ncbi:MAG: amylo-alpha-1,6-glucosidase [Phycisphaerae bacterium]
MNSSAQPTAPTALPEPITVDLRTGDLDELLSREWLLTNEIGAYASSTVLGCNTRRYHGLLVAATTPPTGRVVTLSTVMEDLEISGERHELAVNEFPGAVAPDGRCYLEQFRNDQAATFVYRIGEAQLVKEVLLSDAANAVVVRYTLHGNGGVLHVRPFVAMRDFHHLRSRSDASLLTFETTEEGLVIQDRAGKLPGLYVISREAAVEPGPDWWYRFRYRTDAARGQDCLEDLYTPGVLRYELADGESCQFTAGLGSPRPVGFETTRAARQSRLQAAVEHLGDGADDTTRRLAVAADAFIVRRSFPGRADSATILAGFHWFADWGRDTFIALPGLLLSTGRFDQARRVFRTFTAHVSDGMVPNRFDDYSSAAHYNSIDASLWFIVAAERYVAATGDTDFWLTELLPAVRQILHGYESGTLFDIHADADGLLCGGSADTQLTWMDAQSDGHPVTPRHGKAVEINALWYCAHRIVADRCGETDAELAGRHLAQAQMISDAFNRMFWNDAGGCLYDCVGPGGPDDSFRPNQIFGVSLPFSPLPAEKQKAVVTAVGEKLLTPLGLRTLAPDDPRYRGTYSGGWSERDEAYHQGTAWAWLMGAFIEAYLKVHQGRGEALEQARRWLQPFDVHLGEAGLGFISEIFDGDPPHTPRGCIAQAWSVGEVLRAKRLIEQYEGQGNAV